MGLKLDGICGETDRESVFNNGKRLQCMRRTIVVVVVVVVVDDDDGRRRSRPIGVTFEHKDRLNKAVYDNWFNSTFLEFVGRYDASTYKYNVRIRTHAVHVFFACFNLFLAHVQSANYS